MNDALQDALAAIPGVAAAEVELAPDGPPAVRLRLTPGADQGLVAASVQRLLEAHGLRSRVAPARRPTHPNSPPAPPGTGARRVIAPPAAPVSVVTEPASDGESDRRSGPEPTFAASRRGIARVAVEESPSGATVRVTGRDGRVVERRTRPQSRAVDEAIVSAVGELIDPNAPSPALVAVEEEAGGRALTVVVEGPDASMRVGAALLGRGRSLAVAEAAWVALRSDDPD